MAFVDHDQVEEIRRKLLVDILIFLAAGDRLIKGQVNLVALVDLAFTDLGHRRAKRLEIVVLGLIDQNVTVGQKQDAFLGAGFPQSPDDLKRGIGLAGAGRHDQQDALLLTSHGFDRVVNGIRLVIARRTT